MRRAFGLAALLFCFVLSFFRPNFASFLLSFSCFGAFSLLILRLSMRSARRKLRRFYVPELRGFRPAKGSRLFMPRTKVKRSFSKLSFFEPLKLLCYMAFALAFVVLKNRDLLDVLGVFLGVTFGVLGVFFG